jgi:hypothetical protein
VSPQTGLPVDKWDCAISLIPIMLVQVGGKTDQVAAAVESTRNEVTTGLERAAMAAMRSIEDNNQRRPALRAVNQDD